MLRRPSSMPNYCVPGVVVEKVMESGNCGRVICLYKKVMASISGGSCSADEVTREGLVLLRPGWDYYYSREEPNP
jgi:hypothetical protein